VLQLTGESDDLPVQAVSDNSNEIIGRTPSELLSLESFTSIIAENQIDEFVERIHLAKTEEADTVTNRFEAFTVSMHIFGDQFREFWCVMHQTNEHPSQIICEFELHDDERTVGCQGHSTIHSCNDTTNGTASPNNHAQIVQPQKRPLIRQRSSEKKKKMCRPVAMDTLNTLSRVQDRLATAPNVESLLEIAVETVKELTGFHRVMVYQFDKESNARVVTEHKDAKASKDAYIGRTFAASNFTSEFGQSHQVNKLRILYDRDHGSARLVCSASKAFQHPLNLTYSYLRAMSDDRLKSLAKLAVRSSVSITVSTFSRLWGLIECYSYGLCGIRIPFPARRVCYLISDMVSRNIERFSYASQLKAKNLVNTLPTPQTLFGCLGISLEPLLKYLRADFAILSVGNTTQVFGISEQPQDALLMLAFLRLKTVTSVLISTNIRRDFPGVCCPFYSHSIGGILVVPLSDEPKDFVVFFRNRQFKSLGPTSRPDDKTVDEAKGRPELRMNLKAQCDTPPGCPDWTEEEVEMASVFAFVCAKLNAISGYDEATLQSSKLTRLLLANSAHEIRTPLNAIINYIEIALEGSLDEGVRERLEESQLTSKSLLQFVHRLIELITSN
jgi:light-regulated signal transduction histidine kinase (bacteriophytochrome)